MEHVVLWAADGGPGEEFRRVAGLEEAVHEVERLRNELGVDAAIFSLTPVPVSFRAYYRVEVPGMDDLAAGAPEEAAPVTDSEEPDAAEVPAEAHAEADEPDPDDFAFSPDSPMAVPSLLPSAAAVPLSRNEGEAEHSLGYFTR